MEAKDSTVDYVTLPALKNTGTRFTSVPRRYEETRPVVIQGFAHRKILCLGQEINKSIQRSESKERENALRSTAESVWAEAEARKHEELEKALKRAHNEHEKAVKKMQKAHERAIRETALRVEGEMNNLVLERVQQEREEGEKRQQEAVRQVELRCQRELTAAVAVARKEERQEATRKAAQVAQQNQAALEAALNSAEREKQEALQQLEAEMLQEKDAAVSEAHAEEQQIAEDKLQHLAQLYEQQIEVVKSHIVDHKKEISRLEKQITRLSEQKSKTEAGLLETRKEFQKFISSVKPFNEGEVDFVIPPLENLLEST